jgi:pimeloyl-[acyl-carrier protein] methyl ester esterase
VREGEQRGISFACLCVLCGENRFMRLQVDVSGHGPDLVLLHGWGMHGGIWDGVREALAQQFRLHVVDLPGYGASVPCEPYTLAGLAAAVAQVLPARAHVCGWSLGGQVALRLALDFPERVRRLVLIGTTPCFRQRADWPHGMDDATLREFAQSLETDYAGTLKRFLSLQARSGDEARAVIAALREKLFARGEPALDTLRGGLAILRDLDLRAALADVAQPALVIHGARDTLTPPAAGDCLARRLPRAELSIVGGAAHAPFLSHRAETLRAMELFLHG